MTTNDARTILQSITHGHTRIVAGVVVTRWADRYELGTWGRDTVTLDEAAEALTGGSAR